jgi:predicted membrane protein
MWEYLKLKALAIYKSINEKHLGLFASLATAVIALIAAYTSNAYAEILSGKLLNISLYIVSCVSITSLYGTIGFDVKKEIAEDQNIALAIIFLGLYIGLALCVFS